MYLKKVLKRKLNIKEFYLKKVLKRKIILKIIYLKKALKRKIIHLMNPISLRNNYHFINYLLFIIYFKSIKLIEI